MRVSAAAFEGTPASVERHGNSDSEKAVTPASGERRSRGRRSIGELRGKTPARQRCAIYLGDVVLHRPRGDLNRDDDNDLRDGVCRHTQGAVRIDAAVGVVMGNPDDACDQDECDADDSQCSNPGTSRPAL